MHIKRIFLHFFPKKQRAIKYAQLLQWENIHSHFNTNLFNFEHALNYHIFAQFTSYVSIKCENTWSYLLASALECHNRFAASEVYVKLHCNFTQRNWKGINPQISQLHYTRYHQKF